MLFYKVYAVLRFLWLVATACIIYESRVPGVKEERIEASVIGVMVAMAAEGFVRSYCGNLHALRYTQKRELTARRCSVSSCSSCVASGLLSGRFFCRQKNHVCIMSEHAAVIAAAGS